jgi:hypothetical protein
LEQHGQKTITVRGSEIVPPQHLVFEPLDASGAECKIARTPIPQDTNTPAKSSHAIAALDVSGTTRKEAKRGRRRGGRRRGGRKQQRSRANATHASPAHSSAPDTWQPLAEPSNGTNQSIDMPAFPDDALEEPADDAHNTPPRMQNESVE